MAEIRSIARKRHDEKAEKRRLTGTVHWRKERDAISALVESVPSIFQMLRCELGFIRRRSSRVSRFLSKFYLFHPRDIALIARVRQICRLGDIADEGWRKIPLDTDQARVSASTVLHAPVGKGRANVAQFFLQEQRLPVGPRRRYERRNGRVIDP